MKTLFLDFDEEKILGEDVVGISIPMHTALCVGVKAGERIRALKQEVQICYFGLYASLNENFLLSGVGDAVIGGEFEGPLVHYVDGLRTKGVSPPGVSIEQNRVMPNLARQEFVTPVRSLLPPLESYSKLIMPDQDRKLVGSTQTTRGCAHRCKHCPIPSVSEGSPVTSSNESLKYLYILAPSGSVQAILLF